MANIQEKIKGKKIVSFKIKVYVGRDENGKQVFRCTTWYPPAGLTNGKARKEVQKVAIVWEDQAKAAYRKELAEGKTVVAGLSRSFEFEKFHPTPRSANGPYSCADRGCYQIPHGISQSEMQ